MKHESELTRRVPDGAKNHTRRYRNDQVAGMLAVVATKLHLFAGKFDHFNGALVQMGEVKSASWSFTVHAFTTRSASIILPSFAATSRV